MWFRIVLGMLSMYASMGLAQEGEETVNFSQLDVYQETVTREKVAHKINTYLKKNPAIEDHYKITELALVLYASKEDKENDRSEYTLEFGVKPAPEPDRFVPDKTSDTPLRGLRVAIDPGHVGGDLAKAEGRYVDMKPSDVIQNRTDVQFNEGTLTLLTAKHLRSLLEEKGATVFLTRENIGEGADKSQCHNTRDHKFRGEKINEFNPHVTFIIHYNAGAGNDKATGQNLGTPENYNMVFVPGSFMAGELRKPRERYEFVRLLVTDDLEESVRLSGVVIRNFEKKLKVPSVGEGNAFAQEHYLRNACIQIEPGVYARNLVLTQRVQSPLCYGESLCQDNFEECIRLASKDVVIDGVPTSSRVQHVAQAYFQSVLDFYGLKK